MSSNSNVDQRGRGKNKHYWTLEQDNALIDCLLELSQNPTWRADCGFKNGYLQQIESMLEAKLPGSNLKASPHIESPIKTLKGKYSCLAELLLCGFNWDEVHSTLVCKKSVFDENEKMQVVYMENYSLTTTSSQKYMDEIVLLGQMLSTTNNQKSGKNKKSKVIDSISTTIGALAESVSEIVPKLQGLADALSDKNVTEMQDNLYT
ncbi:hypothetical protein G4B88_002566 [Cannabis sativa]|uniref:Myb/SANT-like domain-containing protein n=1 Tax=Cannabis sativa TaxID=3483 RepID=A0A7J6I834_CANSA|nr:hypothetical protein G4B88_002566 [Cannabis sativa]